MYILTLAKQTQIFLLSLGFGFILGIIYDIFRIIRLTFSKQNIKNSKPTVIVYDIIYLLLCCFLTFIFILTASLGKFRWYVIVGEILGFTVYYFSFGFIVINVSNKIIDILKRIISFIFMVIFKPVSIIYRFITKNLIKIYKFIKKIVKKISKKLKYHLKYIKYMMYNKRNISTGKAKKEGNG